MTKVLITQSNYIPWMGYFDAISQADICVFLDNVQYTRRDWRNRNKILTPQGPIWLSIPVQVKGKYHQLINETLVSSKDWGIQHWQTLKHNYKKAPHFHEYESRFQALYHSPPENLSLINKTFIRDICGILNIKTVLRDASEFQTSSEPSQRLVDICAQLEATHYLTGPSARAYLDIEKFKQRKIQVSFFDFNKYPPYPQVFQGGDVHLSVLDPLFNIGRLTMNYLGKSPLEPA